MLSRGFVLALLAGGIFGCGDKDDLAAICPSTCYTGVVATQGVGVCKQGTPVCDDRGNVLECLGEVVPSFETCDGLDNDCDGEVDEHLVISPQDPDNQCKQCGRCRGTWEKCDMGNWYCDYETPPTETDEVCDGLDEDCDCQEDEDVRQNNEVVFCYTGPTGTVTKGECRPGVETCVQGRLFCVGEATPRPETCDGTDQDCNGVIDDVPREYEGTDIVFGIDISGSMLPFLTAILQATCNYSQSVQQDAALSVRIGLVTISAPQGYYELAQDLTDAQTFCDILQNTFVGSGTEPTLSAAEAVVNPENPLGISWRPSSRRMFIGFTDERAQVTCTAERCGVQDTLANSIDYCQESGALVYWFVKDAIEPFAIQARSCGGDVLWLADYGGILEEQLHGLLVGDCAAVP